jgi:hypothetical protein
MAGGLPVGTDETYFNDCDTRRGSPLAPPDRRNIMPTSRRQKHAARNLPNVSTPPVHPSTAHPSSAYQPAKLKIPGGRFGTVRAFAGPKAPGR